MNKDRAKGKMKDIAGRIERQTGEWTGDTEAQVKGAVKQVEGKVQNALGKVKEAMQKPAEDAKPPRAGKSGDDSAKTEEEESVALRQHTG
jgi:uncharacterized protein YjbJ (UPF0337 family)